MKTGHSHLKTANMSHLFHRLACFHFTAQGPKIDYYHQQLNERAAKQVAKRFEKLRNFKKISECLKLIATSQLAAQN